MAMPNNIVFIRHGQSEPNEIHKAERNNIIHEAHGEVYQRPDWKQRLGAFGLYQAEATREWMNENIKPASAFDRCYVSTFLRARETAYIIGGEETMWHVDDRIKERDWGEYGATPLSEREQKFPYASKSKDDNFWFGRHSGGEGMADDVQKRVRDMIGTFHRDMAGKDVLAVAHGELMTALRYIIERMLPEEIEYIANDESQDMKNCTILHYSRENPIDKFDVSDHIAWMRMIYPYDIENSPKKGLWQPVQEKRLVSGADLHKSLEIAPPLTRIG